MRMPQTIYTIGQGSRSVGDLLTELQSRGVRFLCDVRSVPISKHAPDFCAFELRGHLARAGITYVPMGDSLGGRPSDRSVYTADGYVDYDRLIQTESFRAGLDRLIRGATAGHKMAVFCSEGEPERCHRSKAIGRALDEMGSAVIHIDAHGLDISQGCVLTRIAPQVPLLIDMPDPRKFSRGRYTL
jgi:uncharacterized protein (DUF488 family)